MRVRVKILLIVNNEVRSVRATSPNQVSEKVPNLREGLEKRHERSHEGLSPINVHNGVNYPGQEIVTTRAHRRHISDIIYLPTKIIRDKSVGSSAFLKPPRGEKEGLPIAAHQTGLPPHEARLGFNASTPPWGFAKSGKSLRAISSTTLAEVTTPGSPPPG
jgi:hypothetical protein